MALVAFDCDGTLVDSLGWIVGSMREAAGEAGIPEPTDAAVRGIVGLPLGEAIRRVFPGQGPQALAEIEAGYRRAFIARRTGGGGPEPLFPGVRAVLERLNSAGLMCAVVTGKSRRGLVATLEAHGLRGAFAALVTADDGPGKPSPEPLNRAMENCGAAAERTIMVGDTTFDVLTAINAGARAIGVSWGYHPVESLRDAGASAIVASMDEVPGVVARLLDGGG